MTTARHSLVVITLLALGCAEPAPPLVPVKGTVQLDGKPIPGATVKFIPVDGGEVTAQATTGADGSFQLRYKGGKDGAPAGRYKVVLSTERPDQEGAEIFPARYHNPDQTQLVVTVTEAGNTLNLDAESDKSER